MLSPWNNRRSTSLLSDSLAACFESVVAVDSSCPVAAGSPCPVRRRCVVYTGDRMVEITLSASALRSIGSGASFREILCAYRLGLRYGLELLGAPICAAPILTAWYCTPASSRGRGGVVLCHGGVRFAWMSDAGWPFSYTREMRTVKITYCDLIFFCDCLCYFGVGRCLGYKPSGGL